MQKSRNSLVLVILILSAFLCSGERAAAAPVLPSGPSKFSLDVDMRNNLWSFEKFYVPVSEEEVLKMQNIPSVLLARETLNFRLPLKQKKDREWGFLYLQTGWLQVTGESAEFYRDALEGTEPRRYYDLGFSGQSYKRLGLYASRRWEQTGVDFAVRGDLFLCPGYREWKGSGQGRLVTSVDGLQNVEIYGVYSELWREKEVSPGIGAALSWEVRAIWISGAGMELRVANLPGLVWFSRLTRENKKIDSKMESIGPVHVSGKKEQKAAGIELPLEATAVFFRPAGPGLLFFTAATNGTVRDFSAGYHHPINESYTFIAEVNPVMHHLVFGWSWSWGDFRLYLDRSTSVFIKGATISVRK